MISLFSKKTVIPAKGGLTVKRKILILALCACLLCCCLTGPGSLADGGVCFISVNDRLLEINSMPYFSGGVTYVPYWVFTDYDFKIYFSYLPEASTAILYNSDHQLFFDMANNTAYDDRDNSYNYRAVLRNGVVYVPASLVCSFFGGMSCTYLSGGKYGDVVRIKDSNYVLTDVQFMLAADLPLQSRYEAYMAAQKPAETPAPSVPEVSPAPVHVHRGTAVYLSFTGLPDAAILSALRRENAEACFFLTAEQVRSDPALVRQLDGEGFKLGVLCSADALSDYEETAALIFETAHTKTLLVTALGEDAAECRSMAEENGLIFWSYDLDGMSTDAVTVYASNIVSVLELRAVASSLFLSCDKVTSGFILPLLRTMDEMQLDLCAVRETDVWP